MIEAGTPEGIGRATTARIQAERANPPMEKVPGWELALFSQFLNEHPTVNQNGELPTSQVEGLRKALTENATYKGHMTTETTAARIKALPENYKITQGDVDAGLFPPGAVNWTMKQWRMTDPGIRAANENRSLGRQDASPIITPEERNAVAKAQSEAFDVATGRHPRLTKGFGQPDLTPDEQAVAEHWPVSRDSIVSAPEKAVVSIISSKPVAQDPEQADRHYSELYAFAAAHSPGFVKKTGPVWDAMVKKGQEFYAQFGYAPSIAGGKPPGAVAAPAAAPVVAPPAPPDSASAAPADSTKKGKFSWVPPGAAEAGF